MTQDSLQSRQAGFKAALRARQPLFGYWSSMCNPVIAELMALNPLDWVLLDMEHAANTPATLHAQMLALETSGMQPVVRVPGSDPRDIKLVLDLGVSALVFPMVEDAAQAARVVAHCHYPPAGNRGVSGTQRAAQYGKTLRTYIDACAASVAVICQIESATAASNANDIAAVQGVDGLLVGSRDLAASCGYINDPDHAEVQSLIRKIGGDAARNGWAAGIVASSPEAGARYMDMGYTFFTIAGDVSLIRRSLEKISEEVRILKSRKP